MRLSTVAFLPILSGALHVKRPHLELFSQVLTDAGPSADDATAAERLYTDRELTSRIHAEIDAGFPLAKWDPRPLPTRVQRAQHKGSTNPCEADLLMNGLTYPYGLGARAMMLVDELQVAVLLDKSVAICDGNSQRQGIGWSRFFSNPRFGVCYDLDACYAKSNAAAWLGSEMSKALRKESHGNNEILTQMKRAFYNQFFSFNDATNALITKRLQHAGLLYGQRYVGVHIRRGDKVVSRDWPISRYASVVLKELQKRSLAVVFVASDDEHAGKDLELELGGPTSGYSVVQLFSNSSASRTYDDYDGLLDLLTDVAALRDSEVFIGTHLSYIGRMVYFLRTPEANSISVSGDWLKGEML